MHSLFAVCLRALILLCLPVNLIAQNFQYPYVENFGTAQEYQLGAPNPQEGTQLIPVGIDLYQGDDPNSIYYGMIPPNSGNKPVVVFVDGYASNASVWYEGRDNMYRDVFDDGYRSAFVSLTPNRHMWTNGNMLSNAIDRIRNHYNVSDVVVVGWSKGGVDTDASIVHFGAHSKVSEVFTLSSPHQGTSIAEVANSVLLSLVNIIFMQNNDATKSLTRGYMSYFRSLTDNNPNNTVDYTTLGGWGNGPLARLDIPQTLLHGIDGARKDGGNDGVVPYASSLRPGGRELFDGQRKEYGWFGIPYYPGPDETDLDHFEVTRGSKVWPFIKGVLNGTLRTAPNQTPSDYRIDPTVRSQTQVIASQGTDKTFYVHQQDEEVRIMLLGQDLPETLTAVAQATGSDIEFELTQESEEGRVYLASFPEAGAYQIALEGDYVAMVASEGGPTAVLTPLFASGKSLFAEGDAVAFEVQAEGLNPAELEGLQVHGTLHRIHDLEFNPTTDAPSVLNFTWDGNAFQASASKGLPAGVYSISVTVEGEGFVRTLVSSVAKLGNEEASSPAALNITNIYPNPFTESATIELNASSNGTLQIYDLQGRPVKTMDVADGNHSIQWNAKAEGMTAGMYIIEYRNEAGQQMSRRLVLQ